MTPVECNTPLDELERVENSETDGSQKKDVDKFRVDSTFVAIRSELTSADPLIEAPSAKRAY